MAKSTRWRGRARQVGRGNRVQAIHRPEPPMLAPDLSRSGRMRLAMVDWHRSHGQNVSRTARHFGVSRPTVYRWLGRFDRFRLETLEDRASAPRRRRRPTWTVDLLRRAGIVLSVSMIGRILARLRRSGELHEPIGRRRMNVQQRRWLRPYAIRKPVDWPVDPELVLAPAGVGLADRSDGPQLVVVAVGLEVGGGQVNGAVDVEGVKTDASAVQVRPGFHQAGEALGEDLHPPTDRSFRALELGLHLVCPSEALLKLAGEYGPSGHGLRTRCREADFNADGMDFA